MGNRLITATSRLKNYNGFMKTIKSFGAYPKSGTVLGRLLE